MKICVIMVRFIAIVLLLCPIALGKFVKTSNTDLWRYEDGPWKPLFEAARDDDLQKAENEVRKGIDVNIRGDDTTALHVAAEYGKLKHHDKIAAFLIEHGANISAGAGYAKRPPLRACGVYGSKNVAQLLIQHGADVNAADTENWTPLHVAARNGHDEVVELLINHGANINVGDLNGWTPLHLAVGQGEEKIAEYLIQKGANINAETKEKYTPLYFAVLFDHERLVEMLLNKGAITDVRNVKGKTPLDVAIENDNKKIIELLSPKPTQPPSP